MVFFSILFVFKHNMNNISDSSSSSDDSSSSSSSIRSLTEPFSSHFPAGMFQRLDKMRKNAFASVLVFGEDGANCISGIWVWRGQELAFPVSGGGGGGLVIIIVYF